MCCADSFITTLGRAPPHPKRHARKRRRLSRCTLHAASTADQRDRGVARCRLQHRPTRACLSRTGVVVMLWMARGVLGVVLTKGTDPAGSRCVTSSARTSARSATRRRRAPRRPSQPRRPRGPPSSRRSRRRRRRKRPRRGERGRRRPIARGDGAPRTGHCRAVPPPARHHRWPPISHILK